MRGGDRPPVRWWALLLLHDPDPVPCLVGRTGLVVAATVEEDAGRPVLRCQIERLGEMSETTRPVAALPHTVLRDMAYGSR